MRRFLALLTAAVIAYALWGDSPHKVMNRVRAFLDFTPTIAVVYPDDATGEPFLAGSRLAIEEVNAAGGLKGQQVTLLAVRERAVADGAQGVRSALALAGELADNPNIIAIIGHGSSDAALPAVQIYERAKKLFLSTYATNVTLVSAFRKHAFNLLPDNRVSTEAVAQYAEDSGHRNIVILAGASDYAQQSAVLFAQSGFKRGLNILHRINIDFTRRTVHQVMQDLLDNPRFPAASIDAIMLVSSGQEIGRLIREMRLVGLKVPILGLDNMDDPDIINVAGTAMEGTVAINVTDMHAASSLPNHQKFFSDYRKRTGEEPITVAALGYDAIHLIKRAAEYSASLSGEDLADSLHLAHYFGPPYEGISSRYAFDRLGRAVKRDIYVLRHDGKGFQRVRAYRTAETEGVSGSQ